MVIPIICENYTSIKYNILDKYSTFLIDMDGVVWTNNVAVLGAREALLNLQKHNKNFFFVSNNSLFTIQELADKLKNLNIGDFSGDIIFSSATALVDYIRNIKYKGKVLLLASPPIKKELEVIEEIEIIDGSLFNHISITPMEMAHVKVDESIGCVVAAFDPHLNYYKISYASLLLKNNPNVVFVTTNQDNTFPTATGSLPGTGSLVAPIKIATEREPVITGKPSKYMMDSLLKRYPNLKLDEICMIGDNILTDIVFGNNVGISTCLVESGVHTRHSLDKFKENICTPTFIVPSLFNFAESF